MFAELGRTAARKAAAHTVAADARAAPRVPHHTRRPRPRAGAEPQAASRPRGCILRMESIVEAEEAALVEMEPQERHVGPIRAERSESGKLLSMKRYSDHRARMVTTPLAPRRRYERAAA